MKKIVIHQAGGYEKLKFEEHADLSPGPGEVVVEVKAAGINYADCCVRWGVYESAKQLVGWPITPGFEFSGLVKAVGEGVKTWKKDDPVLGVSFFNAYATQVKAKEHLLYPMPKNMSFEEAAGFPAVFLTAYHALFQLVRLPFEAEVLIHSAAGGVGSALVQLCLAKKLRPVGVIGSSHKREYLTGLGIERIIDKSQEDLWMKAKAFCPRGYDAVLDANGPSTLRQSYEALRPTGKLIAYGAHTMLPQGSQSGKMNYLKAAMGFIQLPRFNPMDLISQNKSVVGFNLSFLFERDDLVDEAMGELLQLVHEQKIKAPKVTVFPLDQVGEAHRQLESGQTTGKLILSCSLKG